MHAGRDDQGADALGPVDLVAGEGVEVHALARHVDRHAQEALHAVDVHQGARVLLLDAAGDLGDGHARADLVVDLHDADQGRLPVHGRNERVHVHHALRVDVRIGHAAAQALDLGHGLQHRGVLDLGGEEVAAAAAQGALRAEDGQVVRLGAAGGKEHLPAAAHGGEDFAPGLGEDLPRAHGGRVEGGRVKIGFAHAGGHGLDGAVKGPCGCAVVQIDHRAFPLPGKGGAALPLKRTISAQKKGRASLWRAFSMPHFGRRVNRAPAAFCQFCEKPLQSGRLHAKIHLF